MVSWTCETVLGRLRSLGDPEAAEKAARFGVHVAKIWGVSAPNLRKLARGVGKNHKLAGQLWRTGVHDARVLATRIDSKAARWIASDALRELTNRRVQARLKR